MTTNLEKLAERVEDAEEDVDYLVGNLLPTGYAQGISTIRLALRHLAAAIEDKRNGVVGVPEKPVREQWAEMGDAVVKLHQPIHHDIISESVYEAAIKAAPQSRADKILEEYE